MARPREFDEAAVIRMATDQFWSGGYRATSMDDLMTVTGLGKGSLYGAFGDKRSLFLRVLDGYCEERVTLARQALLGPESDALDRLRAYVLGTVEAATRPPQLRACLLAKSAAELADEDEEVTSRLQRTFRAIEDALSQCVGDAQRNGDVDPAADARRLARVVLAVLRGIDALSSAGTDPAALRDTAEGALSALTATVPYRAPGGDAYP